MQYANHTLKILEPEIKQGAVETFTVKTSAGNLKKPWGREGGFAVVYKFRTLSGQTKAMRCFRSAITSDIHSRYDRMSRFFHQHVPDITIDFRYYEDGILVKEATQGSQKKVCPVIVMEWIEGQTLLEVVDDLCQQRDCRALGALAEQWLGVLDRMRQARMAHGDLAALNVMVRPNGRMVLIDYDGVYIPEFASMPQVVAGQPGYQHPDVSKRPFDERMDDFSALVIYLSLLALQVQPELWNKHAKRNTQRNQLDGNMLFTNDDFTQPDKALVFYDLLHTNDTRVRDLARKLIECCQQPIKQVRFPLELLDPTYALKIRLQQLESAIQANSDEQVIQLWTEPLASYSPAQVHLPRVNEARQRASALALLKQALATQDIFQIAGAASSIPASRLNTQNRALVQFATNFVYAYQNNNDEEILNCWQEIEDPSPRLALKLGPLQQPRLDLARQRKSALTRFRITCMQSRNAHEIVNAYTSMLDGQPSVSTQERATLEAARSYILMYDAIKDVLATSNGTGGLSRLHEVYNEELDQRFNDFTPREREQFTALKNMGRLELALQSRHDRLALLTAREIEFQMRTPIHDPRLSRARRNFIRAFEARNLQVYLQTGQAFARWDWPDDELVQFAVLVWRPDNWPLHPRKDDPQRYLLRVNRGYYEQYTYFQFPLGSVSQIYVQVFFAISEVAEYTNEQEWYYSRGQEPTSRWPLQLVSWPSGA
jgi:serine/threonine protein kinase